jgi:outer membrane protein OmpA-like peptidoglycan-associated protein
VAAASAKAVGGRVDGVVADVAASRKLIYEVTLSEDQGNFKFGAADLPDEAKARLDQMIGEMKTKPQNIFIEIEGHTDNVGSPELNERLGLDRADAVKRYLYEQHQVPLHKINVISYGEDKPVAPNNTREGRAQNRRVVVKVLS